MNRMSNDLISRDAILKHIEKIRQSLQMMDDTHRASITMTGMHLCEEAVMNQPSAQPEIIRCKDCKWFGDFGCAIRIVEDSDKPTENDFCSFAERKSDG